MPNVYIRKRGRLPRLARRVGARLHWRALWRRGIAVEPWWHGLPPRMWRIQHVNCRCWPSPIVDNFGIRRQLTDAARAFGPPPTEGDLEAAARMYADSRKRTMDMTRELFGEDEE